MRARERRVNRYYDPSTDQFLSIDPDVAETGQPYTFTGDDPLNGTDPLGLITCGGWLSVFPCGVVTDVQNGLSGAAQATAHWITNNASTLSAIASGLATLAYVACAATAGTGCAVGAVLSGISTGLAGLNAYHACSTGKACISALVSVGLSGLGTLSGVALQAKLATAFSFENQLMSDLALARGKGLGQAAINGIEGLISAAEKVVQELKNDQKHEKKNG